MIEHRSLLWEIAFIRVWNVKSVNRSFFPIVHFWSPSKLTASGMWPKIAFIASFIFDLLIVQFWTAMVANCSNIFKTWPFPNQLVYSFLSFPFNFYFVTFRSGSLAWLGFVSDDNALGFSDSFQQFLNYLR